MSFMNKKKYNRSKKDSTQMTYGEYLKIDLILSQQQCLSSAHDEMLFIIQHQTSELWMKLVLYEMTAARNAIKSNDLANMFKMLARVSRIFEQLKNLRKD